MTFLPERLIALRTAQGITRAEAARRLNMSAMGYGRDYLYGLSDDVSPSSITIHSSDDPDLFQLVQTAQANKGLTSRLLAYANHLQDLNQKQ